MYGITTGDLIIYVTNVIVTGIMVGIVGCKIRNEQIKITVTLVKNQTNYFYYYNLIIDLA
jgi:hypothetical protein